MSPNDIKRIVNCVVDYGWPWQYDDWQSPFVIAEDQSLGHLLYCLYLQECKPDRDDLHVRLDPGHVWDWPIESRDDMPCWTKPESPNMPEWHKYETVSLAKNDYPNWHMYIVAIHPLNLTMEPPAGWVADGKRILK
jgi:hypothetical protein